MGKELKFGLPPAPTAEELKEYGVTPSPSPVKSASVADDLDIEEPDTTLGEDVEAFAAALGQGATFGFGDEMLGALEAFKRGVLGPEELSSVFKIYREAQQRNQSAYEKMAEKNKTLTTLGELIGGFALPVPGAAAGGLARISGATKAAKLLGAGEKMASHIGTGTALGALSGVGTSRGTIEGTFKKGEEGLVGDMLTGGFGGGALGLASGIGHKMLEGTEGLLTKRGKIDRAVAAKEMEAGERAPYTSQVDKSLPPEDRLKAAVDLAEKTRTSPFQKPTGPQRVIQNTKNVADEIADNALSLRQEAKDVLNKQLAESGDNIVNELDLDAEIRARDFLNERYPDWESRNDSNDLFRQAKSMFGAVGSPYNDMQGILYSSQKIRNVVEDVDNTIFGKMMGSEPISVSEMYNFRRSFMRKAGEYADEHKLSSLQRDILFGKGDYKGAGLVDNIEAMLSQHIPLIKNFRDNVKITSYPIEALFNRSENPALHTTKLWDFADDSDLNKYLREEIQKLVKKAGGQNVTAEEAAVSLKDFFSAMRERNAQLLKTGRMNKNQYEIEEGLLGDLSKKTDMAATDFAALAAYRGIEAVEDVKATDVINAFKPGTEGLTKMAARYGAAKTIGKEAIESIPSYIRKPLGATVGAPFTLKDKSIAELKELAAMLSKSGNPLLSNIGKGSMQSLEENHLGKAVFLNQAYQNKSIRDMLGLSLTKEEEEQRKKEQEGE
jgi:hypothetical protein